ncbi:MAG: hypothetical protein ACI9W2_000097 [Gammaproteobacteria bacterium]
MGCLKCEGTTPGPLSVALKLPRSGLVRFLLCKRLHKRKAWLFKGSEIGAERVGIIQSLLTTCRLHDVNPSIYLIDVLQRVETHPASRVDELMPRNWKTHFADDPLRSDVYEKNA